MTPSPSSSDLDSPNHNVLAPGSENARPTPLQEVLLELVQASISSQREAQDTCLEGVNWQVARGQSWVIAGPPDCGKSALLATAAGLYEPVAGQLLIKGKPLASLGESQPLESRLTLGLVNETRLPLFHNLTLAQNIALPLQYHRNLVPSQVEPRVGILLDQMELDPWAHRPPARVSRAMRQRAVLARALALEPELLLLDNPLAGLGPSQVGWWLDLFERLRLGQTSLGLQPITLVVATDACQPWLRFDAQFALIKDRRWILLGSREDLLASQEPLVRELLSDMSGYKSM